MYVLAIKHIRSRMAFEILLDSFFYVQLPVPLLHSVCSLKKIVFYISGFKSFPVVIDNLHATVKCSQTNRKSMDKNA